MRYFGLYGYSFVIFGTSNLIQSGSCHAFALPQTVFAQGLVRFQAANSG